MSDDRLRELARLALQAAIDAPLRKNKWVQSGYVRWSTIDAIRAECDRLGIDWRSLHPQNKKKETP